MGKFGAVLSFGFAIWSTYLGISSFSDYFTKPNEANLRQLESTSAYVKDYNGKNPKESLEKLQGVVEILKKDKTFHGNLKGLEGDIQEAIQTGQYSYPYDSNPYSRLNFIGLSGESLAYGEIHKDKKAIEGFLELLFAAGLFFIGKANWMTGD